jgi:hypothetical protein
MHCITNASQGRGVRSPHPPSRMQAKESLSLEVERKFVGAMQGACEGLEQVGRQRADRARVPPKDGEGAPAGLATPALPCPLYRIRFCLRQQATWPNCLPTRRARARPENQ